MSPKIISSAKDIFALCIASRESLVNAPQKWLQVWMRALQGSRRLHPLFSTDALPGPPGRQRPQWDATWLDGAVKDACNQMRGYNSHVDTRNLCVLNARCCCTHRFEIFATSWNIAEPVASNFPASSTFSGPFIVSLSVALGFSGTKFCLYVLLFVYSEVGT
ncbi:unnamed protein product [Somion occarium]|uniref:Uncharacterized protein n=1 Tax=Somion occarium TaxID=3059160 RepID=A0ABP1CK54_9APHY